MPLGKRKTTTVRRHRPPARPDAAHRIADALERIGTVLERMAKRQAAFTLTQKELDELYVAATSNVTANDALQARLRKAIGKN